MHAAKTKVDSIDKENETLYSKLKEFQIENSSVKLHHDLTEKEVAFNYLLFLPY